MTNQDRTVSTYQIGNATVRIHGDPDQLNREKLAELFGDFMAQVYDFRAEKAREAAESQKDNQGA